MSVQKQRLIQRLTELHDRIAPRCVGDIYLSRTDIKTILKAFGRASTDTGEGAK